ncbi:MAG: hypothetical protein LBB11_01460 [Puniceicoccales bacterium]|jgi:hypothetical protein|nr:hypothetical protein [Puniceicoccales bacterium]
MENNIQYTDHCNSLGLTLTEALLNLAQKIICDIGGENLSLGDSATLAGILQKLVSCYGELRSIAGVRTSESRRLVSQDVLDDIQVQLNLF